jgi:hypothetical protein
LNDFPLLAGETPEQAAAREEAERMVAVAGEEMDVLLRNKAFTNALKDVGKDFYQEFLKAGSDAERLNAQSRGVALLGLAKELRSVSERGRMAKHARKTRAAAKEAREARMKRKALDESPQEN